MDLDARILRLIRQGPGVVSTRDLCVLLFPTFTLQEMEPLVTALVGWRCHLLVQAGRLVEVTKDHYVWRRWPRRVYLA